MAGCFSIPCRRARGSTMARPVPIFSPSASRSCARPGAASGPSRHSDPGLMRVLALDTATEACSVALLTEHGLIVGLGGDRPRPCAGDFRAWSIGSSPRAGRASRASSGIAAGIRPGLVHRRAGQRRRGAGARVRRRARRWRRSPASRPWRSRRSAPGRDQVLACLDARMGEVYWGCFAARMPGMLSALGPAGGGSACRRAPARRVRLHAASGVFRGIGRGFAAYPELCALPGLRVAARRPPRAAAGARHGAPRRAATRGGRRRRSRASRAFVLARQGCPDRSGARRGPECGK